MRHSTSLRVKGSTGEDRHEWSFEPDDAPRSCEAAGGGLTARLRRDAAALVLSLDSPDYLESDAIVQLSLHLTPAETAGWPLFQGIWEHRSGPGGQRGWFHASGGVTGPRNDADHLSLPFFEVEADTRLLIGCDPLFAAD